MPPVIDNLRSHREEMLEIARKHHAENLRVFGSVARKEDSESSDIDILATFQEGATLLDQVRMIEALTELLGRPVDVVSERALNLVLRDRIEREARPL